MPLASGVVLRVRGRGPLGDLPARRPTLVPRTCKKKAATLPQAVAADVCKLDHSAGKRHPGERWHFSSQAASGRKSQGRILTARGERCKQASPEETAQGCYDGRAFWTRPEPRQNDLPCSLAAMDQLTLFGLFAVTAMVICYALESRSHWLILAFAVSCVLGSIYGFLQGAWPFGLVEAVWSLIALRRWWAARPVPHD
jgi:hypothetical protein